MHAHQRPAAHPRPRVDINALLRARPRPCRYGAPLGARDVDTEPEPVPLYLQRVRFTDGDYGPDGTYWGGGRGTLPLWCAFTPSLSVCIYLRAPSRDSAAEELADTHGHTLRRPAARAMGASVPA